MRFAIGPDGLAPDGLARDVGVEVEIEVDICELLDANKLGRNLYAPNAINPKVIIKNVGLGLLLLLLCWDIMFSPYIIYTASTEKLLTTISIQESSVKVNSLNSLIMFIKVIFVFLGKQDACSTRVSAELTVF
ncbi:hypothetical protein [Microcoleus sp. K5-D4]|uniref:hypothetical protein n=1 Tax=Microcoleus sp. K5-D4 TaxID=2818801 RepID=UPI002FD42ECB